MDFAQTLLKRFEARYGVIWVQTSDYQLFYKHIKYAAREGDYTLYRWSSAEGLMELGLMMDTSLPIGDIVGDVTQVLAEAVRRTDELNREIFVVEGIYDQLQYPNVQILLRKLAVELPESKYPIHVVLPSPHFHLPRDVVRYVDALAMPTADQAALREELKHVEKMARNQIDDALAEQLCIAAEGLTLLEARNIFKLVAVETGFEEAGIEVVQRERQRIMDKLEMLQKK